jgi:hypothetical protein
MLVGDCEDGAVAGEEREERAEAGSQTGVYLRGVMLRLIEEGKSSLVGKRPGMIGYVLCLTDDSNVGKVKMSTSMRPVALRVKLGDLRNAKHLLLLGFRNN